MMDDLLRYTLRVNRELFRKFLYIAESEGCSVNKDSVRNFEEKHGEIALIDQEK